MDLEGCDPSQSRFTVEETVGKILSLIGTGDDAR
jgi:hypothetical protein